MAPLPQLLNRCMAQAMGVVPPAWVRPFAMEYIAGETVDQMLAVVQRLNRGGCMATVDVLGEFIRTPAEAEQAAAVYHVALDRIRTDGLDANISVKLSQLGLLLDKALCYRLMLDLVGAASRTGNFVRIDMEDAACTAATLDLYLRLRQEFDNVGIVLQAYLRRTMADARHVMVSKAGHFRLCKGIYVESEAVAYQDPALINKNYAWVLAEMFKHGAYVGIATHDEDLVWEAERLIDAYGLKRDQYEFQMLLGVKRTLRQRLLDQGHRVRVYVPFGEQWHAYSMRRFQENPSILGHVAAGVWQKLRRRGGPS